MSLGLSKRWEWDISLKTDCFKDYPNAELEKSNPCADKRYSWPQERQNSEKGEVRRSTNSSICDNMHKHNAQPLT